MNPLESISMQEKVDVQHSRASQVKDKTGIAGQYHAQCFDAQGNLKWEETFNNTVTMIGKKYLLDRLDTSYTAVAPIMGLLTGAPSTVDTATMSTVTAVEPAAGTFSAFRVAPAPSVASGSTGTCTKAFAAASFTAAGAGATITGCFLVMGTGAVVTRADANGVLYSLGLFTGKVLAATDVLQITYSTTLA